MKGFTFLEVVLSVSILSIIFSSIFFSYVALDKSLLMQDSEKVKNSIEEIKLLSLIYNQDYYLEFYPEDNSYHTFKSTNHVNEILDTVTLNNVEKISNNLVQKDLITFYENGITASACTITLTSKFHELKLTVNVGSGNVKMGNANRLEK